MKMLNDAKDCGGEKLRDILCWLAASVRIECQQLLSDCDFLWLTLYISLVFCSLTSWYFLAHIPSRLSFMIRFHFSAFSDDSPVCIKYLEQWKIGEIPWLKIHRWCVLGMKREEFDVNKGWHTFLRDSAWSKENNFLPFIRFTFFLFPSHFMSV